jgi:hypothetical protein
MKLQTDVVLVKAALSVDAAQGIEPFRGQLNAHATLARAQVRHFASAAHSTFYLYLVLPEPAMLDSSDLADVESMFAVAFPEATGVAASRLQRVFDLPGASRDKLAAFHYVVETDPEPGWADEIARWYDTEHMPGLASVPGCVRASRLLNHDRGPMSFACYDLMTPDTLGSEAWLAVRHTEWSDRARPHFTNTLRTMFAIPKTGGH